LRHAAPTGKTPDTNAQKTRKIGVFREPDHCGAYVTHADF